FFYTAPPTSETHTLSLHDALPICETYAVPNERLASEREILRPLPSLRPPLRAAIQRTVDRRGSIRFGSARYLVPEALVGEHVEVDRKSTRLNSSHLGISYAVFCLK